MNRNTTSMVAKPTREMFAAKCLVTRSEWKMFVFVNGSKGSMFANGYSVLDSLGKIWDEIPAFED